MSDWEDDPEEPDESEMDFGDSADLRPCPFCKKAIYDHCGKYISDETTTQRKPLWFVITAVAILAAILLGWVLRR
jgi:hypothetical protein